MKPTIRLRSFLLACSSLLLAATAHAQLTWDPGSGGASDGGGAWLGAGEWWDGFANVNWTDSSDAIFGNGGAGGTVTLSGPVSANSINFNAFTGSYTISGNTLTTNTINANTGSGQVTIGSLIDNGGADLTFGGTAAAVTSRSEANINITGGITGAGDLIKEGPGVLWLKSGTLSYTGDTIVNGGVLRVGTSGYLGGTPGNLTLNGGVAESYWSETFTRSLGSGAGQVQLIGGASGFSEHGSNGLTIRFNNDSSTAIVWGSTHFNPTTLVLQTEYADNTSTVTFDNTLDLNGAQRTIQVSAGEDGKASAVMNRAIIDTVGGGGLTKTGDGFLNFIGVDNTYTGDTKILGGTVRFGSSWNNTWNGKSLNVDSNLEINNAIVQANYYLTRDLGTGSGEIQITGGRAGFTNMQSDAAGNAFVKFTDNSTTVTWGSASFAPTTLVLNDTGASAVLRMQNPFDLNGAERTIEVSATGSGGGRGVYGTMEGNLSGVGASLVKTGVGTLMLDGSNTYDSGTTINEGGLWFNKTGAMSTTGSVTVNDGTVLGITLGGGGWTTGTSGVGTLGGLLAGDGGQTAAQVSYVGNVRLSLMASGTQTYAGDIADVGTSLGLDIGNKDGGTVVQDPFADPTTATVVLSGNNTFTGGINLNRGALAIGSATATSSGVITFAGGSIESSDSSARTISNSVLFDAHLEIGGTGDITFSDTSNTQISTTGSTRNFNITNSGTTTFNQVFTPNGGASITKQGTGDMRLNGVSSFGGNINIQQGNLIAGTDSLNNTNGAFGKSSGSITVGQNGGNVDAGALAGGAFTIGRNFQLSSNDNTDTGTRVISFGGNTADESTFTGNIILGSTNRSTVGISLTAAANGKSTFSGVISDPTGQSVGEAANALAGTSVTKTGLGTVVLTNDNTYTGSTSVSEGTLIINGSIAGSLNANVSTTIGGTGTVTGAATISGNHNPGNSPGIQTFASDLSYTGGASVVNWELGDNTTTLGANPTANYDQIVVGGTLDFTGATSLNLLFSGGSVLWSDSLWDADQSWVLYDVTTDTTNFGNLSLNSTDWLDSGSNAFSSSRAGNTFSLSQVGNDVLINYTVVPEPNVAALLGSLGALLLLRRRRA